MKRTKTLSPSENLEAKPSRKPSLRQPRKTDFGAEGRDVSGSNNPRWRGGEHISQGRCFIYCPDHPRPSKCGIYVLRYRLVMESHLGRYLEKNEIVHHLNGDSLDDRIENLEVVSAKEHTSRHPNSLRKALNSRMANYYKRLAENPPKPKRERGERFVYKGMSLKLSEWAEETGLSCEVLRMRINSGWSLERTFESPLQRQGRRKNAQLDNP